MVRDAGGAMEWRRRTEGRGPMLALAGVLLLLGAAQTAREMADTEPGGSAASPSKTVSRFARE